MKRIRARAKNASENGDTLLTRWWSHKYNRPPNDPLFGKRTTASLLEEMLADLYVRRDELKSELKECDNMLERMRLVEVIESINKVLEDPRRAIDIGPVFTGDPLVDEWERDLAEGRTPDLAKGLPANSPLLRRRK